MYAPAAPALSPDVVAAEVVATVAATFWRHRLTFSAASLAFHAPVLLAWQLHGPPAGWSQWLAGAALWALAAAGTAAAIVGGGLAALRGEPVRLRSALRLGALRGGLALQVLFLSFRRFAIDFVVIPSGFIAYAWLFSPEHGGLLGQVTFALWGVIALAASAAVAARVLPAVAVALEAPRAGAGVAVARARALTGGHRWPLTAVVALLGAAWLGAGALVWVVSWVQLPGLVQRAVGWIVAAVVPALLPLAAAVIHESLVQGERQAARVGRVFE